MMMNFDEKKHEFCLEINTPDANPGSAAAPNEQKFLSTGLFKERIQCFVSKC